MKNYKIDNQTIFHRYLCSPNKLDKNQKEGRRSQEITISTQEYGTPTGSTIHLCRLIKLEESNRDNWPICIMKRVAFTYENIKRGANTYAAITHTRKLEQIRTEFLVFHLMANSRRCLRLYELLTENSRRTEDQNFFYKYLGLKKIPGIYNACIIQEYCNGGDLESKIDSMDRPLTEDEIISYASQILEGLNELKKKGVLHRDLRPCNIFLHNNEIKFADFDSAYIYKLSNLTDVSNGIDIDTTPPEIVELASKSQEELHNLGSQKVYQLQSKCDIYFFGTILFKMIFQKNYYKSYEGATLDYLVKEKVTQGYNEALLEAMKESLHWSASKRIDLNTLTLAVSEIQKKMYHKSPDNHRLYLSQDPLSLFQSPEMASSGDSEEKHQENYDLINYKEIQTDFQDQLVRSYRSRFSEIFKVKLEDHISSDKTNNKRYSIENLHIWNINQTRQLQKHQFLSDMESFVKELTVRGFYYDYLYKVILRIDLRSLKNREQREIMKQNKSRLENDLVIALMFIFQLLSRTPFKRDQMYEENNLPYQTRNLFLNLVKINNKGHFFESRTRILNCQDNDLYRAVQDFYNLQYSQSQQNSFEPIRTEALKLIRKIQNKIHQMLIETSIDLIKSYKNKTNEKINLREILLVLVILAQQELADLKKNSLVQLKLSTQPLIYREKTVSDQIQLFFTQFQKRHRHADEKSEKKLNSHKNINSYKNFLPGIPSVKVTGPNESQMNYSINVVSN